MHTVWDEDEYETVVHSRPCSSCGGDLRRCNGACNGSFSLSQVRRSAEAIVAIKAKRQREREDAILAEASAITARRTAELAT